MKKAMKELEQFNEAMNTILRADPKVVKEAMEREKHENAKKRKTKKQSSALDRVSSDKDQDASAAHITRSRACKLGTEGF
jgi:hypothetical protein